MEQLELEVASEFLLIAATLVELKAGASSRSATTSTSTRLAVWEERDLCHRLVECKTFKEAAIALRCWREAGRSQPRVAGVDDRFLGLMPDLLEGVDAEDVRRAFLRAMIPKPAQRIDLEHVAPIRIS